MLPSGVSKATPTQLPLANSVLPINITVPDFWPPWDESTITGSPTCTHEGMGSSINLFKSARLPNEQILISSPSVRSSNTNKDDKIKTTYIHNKYMYTIRAYYLQYCGSYAPQRRCHTPDARHRMMDAGPSTPYYKLTGELKICCFQVPNVQQNNRNTTK